MSGVWGGVLLAALTAATACVLAGAHWDMNRADHNTEHWFADQVEADLEAITRTPED